MNQSTVSYPFLSKAQIAARLAADPAFVLECLEVMVSRQTAYEVESKSTLNRNRQGFMSSHAVRGTEMGLKVRSGESLTEEEFSLAQSIVCRYTRQLAAHFRQVAISENPALQAAAAIFSGATGRESV